MKPRIYFDLNATAPIAEKVKNYYSLALSQWGNASSVHSDSRFSKKVLRTTRNDLASALGLSPLNIIFTASATESNNTILKSLYQSRYQGGLRPKVIISSIEHPSVRETAYTLRNLGKAVVIEIPVSRDGDIDLNFFEASLGEDVALISIMAANNETGHIMPIAQMTQLAKKYKIPFHTDATQLLGKYDFKVNDLGVDYLSFSGHKFYSGPGVGLLCYTSLAPRLTRFLDGGPQERSRRAGTENSLAIGALGVMALDLPTISEKIQLVKELRDYFENKVLEKFPDVIILKSHLDRLANTSSIIFPGLFGETLQMALDLENISVSTGAACSSGVSQPSRVLLSMGYTREEAQSSLRFSFGFQNTSSEVDQVIESLVRIVHRLKTYQNSIQQVVAR